MKLPEVINVAQVRGTGGRKEGDVYIGRPMKGWPSEGFGNPYRITKSVTREEVIERYRGYLEDHPEIVRKLIALKPKRLICWCAPFECHGDVLVEAMKVKLEQ